MPFPRRKCVLCKQEFELRPDKPGFANRCPECSLADEEEHTAGSASAAVDREQSAERRRAMKDLLYRKDA